MQLLKNVNVDRIGKKTIFTGPVCSECCLLGAQRWTPLWIDFSGGTLVYVKFRERPPLDAIRAALKQRGLGESSIRRFGPEADHEVIISLDERFTDSRTRLD